MRVSKDNYIYLYIRYIVTRNSRVLIPDFNRADTMKTIEEDWERLVVFHVIKMHEKYIVCEFYVVRVHALCGHLTIYLLFCTLIG